MRSERRKGMRSFLCSRSTRPRKGLARRPQSKASHALAWLSIELKKRVRVDARSTWQPQPLPLGKLKNQTALVGRAQLRSTSSPRTVSVYEEDLVESKKRLPTNTHAKTCGDLTRLRENYEVGWFPGDANDAPVFEVTATRTCLFTKIVSVPRSWHWPASSPNSSIARSQDKFVQRETVWW
jgi:hypothetical protein